MAYSATVASGAPAQPWTEEEEYSEESDEGDYTTSVGYSSDSDPSRLSRRVSQSSYVLTGVVKDERPIGTGRFGSVFRARWQGIDVAIKQVSDDFMVEPLINSSGGMLGMEAEAALLFGLRHPNVVSMFGVWEEYEDGQTEWPAGVYGSGSLRSSRGLLSSSTAGASSGGFARAPSSGRGRAEPPAAARGRPLHTYMVMEYISGGDLVSLLRRRGDSFSVTDRLHLLLETARGMQYLAHRSEPVIHRDLACRNLLVWQGSPTDRWHVKVADFGLARSGPIYECVRDQNTSVPLPMKWMAPEAMFGTYSCASDVWSFGVVMWEVFTNGASPLLIPIEDLRVGTRLPQPASCPDAVYALMMRCWELEADDRPLFFHIVQELEVLQAAGFEDHTVSRSLQDFAGSAWISWQTFERFVYRWITNRRLVLFVVLSFLLFFLYTNFFAAEDLVDAPSIIYANEWTPDQVVAWLRGLGPWVEPYVQEFARYGIDGQLLLLVDEIDLVTIGFPKSQATAILRAIGDLRADVDPDYHHALNFWMFRSSMPLFTDQLVTGLQFCPRVYMIFQLVFLRHSTALLPTLLGEGSGLRYWLGWLLFPHFQVAHLVLRWYQVHPILVTIVCIHSLLCTVTEAIALATRKTHLMFLMAVAGMLSMLTNVFVHWVAPRAVSDLQVYAPLVTAPLLTTIIFIYINLDIAARLRSRFFRFTT